MTAATVSASYRFGRFELQPDERRLLADGAPVHLGRHAFDLLTVFVERTGKLLSKDELLGRVWPSIVVEENTLQAHVSALRKALGREAIATISGQGYRFALPVTLAPVAALASSPTPGNLPQQLTSFVGRESTLSELGVLLKQTRLLTLTGSGGCGKTRLAMRLVSSATPAFAQGTWLVDLAAVNDPDQVPRSVARVLGVQEQVGKDLVSSMIDALSTRELLLLVDNVEHLLGACAQLIDALLRAGSGLLVVVTSRERLGIAGELTYRVPSLSLPDAGVEPTPTTILGSESARLFVERARLQKPGFEATASNAAAIASICRRLDGIPLAIELAAPRIRAMSVEEVSRRLDQRFDLLTDGSRTAMPRHRTLRALIDWSYDHLSDAERVLLYRTSVFSGGWTLTLAERICADDSVAAGQVLDLITALVDKNLVVAKEEDDATRYSLLETVRHYARDRLWESGDEALIMARHFAAFLELAEEDLVNLRGARQAESLKRTEAEHDNHRAALAWSLRPAGNPAGGVQMAGALGWFWATRGYLAEGGTWLSSLLNATSRDPPSVPRARALVCAGVIASQHDDAAAAKALYEQGLTIYRQVDDAKGTGYALRSLANAVLAEGDFGAALLLYEESLEIARTLGDMATVGGLLGVIGEVAGEQGDFASARRLLAECLEIQRERGDSWTIGWTHARIGRVAHAQGHLAEADACFCIALANQQPLGDTWGIAWFLEGHAAVVAARGEHPRAARIWGGAERLREQIGAPMPPADRARYAVQVAETRAAMGDESDFERAWSAGRTMTIEQLISHATGFADPPEA